METHAPALAKKSAAPVAATPATSSMFQPRPFAKPEETEEDSPKLQNRNLEKALQAKPINIPLYPPDPALQRQPEIEEEELQRQPQQEELQMEPQLQREAIPEEEGELQTKAIQPKLTIGQPGDKYEQEADSMAAKVMTMPDSAVQREAMPEEEYQELQAKPQIQREAMPEEDDELQMKPQLQRQTMPIPQSLTQSNSSPSKIQNPKSKIQAKGEAPTAPANFDSQLAQHKGSGQPLSDETRAFMEPRFGADFSNVRVHEAPDLANAIQAQAFTHGQDIYFNSGKYIPGSSSGKELLAHELTHVVQQRETVQLQENEPSAQSSGVESSTSGETFDKEEGKRLFNQAKEFYENGQYRQAIIHFERLRQMPGISEEIKRPLLYNIGVSNIRLRRFATAIFYLEQYILIPGADVELARAHLQEAKSGLGISPGETTDGESTSEAASSTSEETFDKEEGKRLFNQAKEFYESGRYRQAIIHFERLRQMPGISEEIKRPLLYNIGVSNIRLRRFATAIFYLEQYILMPGADVESVETHLREVESHMMAGTTNSFSRREQSRHSGNHNSSENTDISFGRRNSSGSVQRARLSEIQVTNAVSLGSYVRLTFNVQITLDEAISFLWLNGANPPVNFFMPDESDPFRSERYGYTRFLILPSASVLEGIRPEVHRIIYESLPQYEGGVNIPDFVPKDVQKRIRQELQEQDDNRDFTISGAWPSPEQARGLYWLQRRGRTTYFEAATLPDPQSQRNHLQREATETVNRDVVHFVVNQKLSIQEAKTSVRRLHGQILRMLIAGYIQAFVIYGRANPAPTGVFPHEAVR